MNATAKEPLDRKGARALGAVDEYTLQAFIRTECGRRKIADEVINMLAEDLRREGHAQALRFIADDLAEVVPGLVIGGLRVLADQIESGEVTLP